ncbi:hypothetical protein POM88_022744 [Heracleum sosnowskyi]|uniref:Uncharacterized protein n=1 Tax=Heracleum sosnowskyi TaxID=360622 RepID=A0AAD8M0G3_9APIA|nr:hypothetical protein POM88_049327 [Heracleum sosnowskyi]KAK1385009.1 hypothetical protein POM88_022744 [Heracleum sosnowskyi]
MTVMEYPRDFEGSPLLPLEGYFYIVNKQAPKELLYILSPFNRKSSQLRYLEYVSRKCVGNHWPPEDIPFALDCIIFRVLPVFDGGAGCRPVVHVYGQVPSSSDASKSSKFFFQLIRPENMLACTERKSAI